MICRNVTLDDFEVVEPIEVEMRKGPLGWIAVIPELGVSEFGDTPDECYEAVQKGLAFAFSAYAEEEEAHLDAEAREVAKNLRARLRRRDSPKETKMSDSQEARAKAMAQLTLEKTTKFIHERMAALLKYPEAWGSVQSVVLQYVTLDDVRAVLEGREPDAWKRFLQRARDPERGVIDPCSYLSYNEAVTILKTL